MSNIEYKWVGEHHAAIIVNGEVEAYINFISEGIGWKFHDSKSDFPAGYFDSLEDVHHFITFIFKE